MREQIGSGSDYLKNINKITLNFNTLETQKAHPYAKWSLLSYNTSKSVVNCGLAWSTKQEEKIQTRTKKVYISSTSGDAPLKPIATIFRNSLYLTEVINCSKFGVDWYSSFGSGEEQNLPFPIGTITGPYHCSATALARDKNIRNEVRHYTRHHIKMYKIILLKNVNQILKVLELH